MQKINKFKYIAPLLLLAIFLASLSSCVDYDEIEIQEIKSVKLIDISDKGLLVESEVKINNPNSFSVSIVDSDIRFSIKGVEMGSAFIKDKLKLKNNTAQYYTLQLESKFKDMGPGYLGKLLQISSGNNKNVKFKFEGFIVGRVFLIKHKVEVDYSGNVPLGL